MHGKRSLIRPRPHAQDKVKMPKKKTGARKKAEKQKKRQKGIRASVETRDIVQQPCDFLMVSSKLPEFM